MFELKVNITVYNTGSHGPKQVTDSSYGKKRLLAQRSVCVDRADITKYAETKDVDDF